MRLIVVNDVSEALGGATKVALQCLEAGVAAGLDCAVLVGDDGAGIRSRFPGVEVKALGERPLRDGVRFTNLFDRNFNRRAYRALRRLLDTRSDATVVHVHGWSQILSPSIFHALARSKAKVIVTAHDFFLSCPNGAYVHYDKGEICAEKPLSAGCLASACDKRNYLHKLWRFARSMTQTAAGEAFWSRVGVILVHEGMEPYLSEGPLRNFLTLRTPSTPLTQSPVEAWRNSRPMFLGRMSVEKGVRTLAEALNATGKAATLIGRGPLLEEIQHALPHCYVPGWLDVDEVAAVASRARYFFMPSRMPEPYGLVAAEALMCGIPVIASSNALIATEIEQHQAGLVFESGNAESLAEIMALMESDALVRHLSRGAFAYGKSVAPSRAEWSQRIVDIYSGRLKFVTRDKLKEAMGRPARQEFEMAGRI
ncbi:polysaccharide biosynthesis protein [Sinorhizobium sp. A49]|uniref:glycosyltransferase family 4 protein n=1 Tax=Sinorhizobium sp. A49 TaxID=1945861 RepID=UPI000984C456|nr:glycosyltransferase family 4 protein [Sinorhizobium sp. A49]OOG69159.1 polysaccharide biosynthesis protein [Sinorhizobium sp. A49]